jgi:hypothetical protein
MISAMKKPDDQSEIRQSDFNELRLPRICHRSSGLLRGDQVTVRLMQVTDLETLIRELEKPALSADRVNVFRGHNNSDWRLSTTFSRWSTSQIPEYNPMMFERLLNRFEHGLTQIGNREMASINRRGRLEFARHHGIPSPLIDFSFSPFVALWFAFNGIRKSVDNCKFAALYVLDFNLLGIAFDSFVKNKEWAEAYTRLYGRPAMDVFRWEISDYFENGYPQPALKFTPHAASWNTKVQRQMGCFIYDSMDYNSLNLQDLEDFIQNAEEARNKPILTKLVVPCSLAGEVFNYLDVIGINGARLMDDHTGVACDVRNTFNYNPRAVAWDLKRAL